MSLVVLRSYFTRSSDDFARGKYVAIEAAWSGYGVSKKIFEVQMHEEYFLFTVETIIKAGFHYLKELRNMLPPFSREEN